GAFRNNNISNLTIPSHVKDIGRGSFGNNEIESLTIENGIESIGDFAFSNNEITEATIPESVSYLGSDIFYTNQIQTIEVNDGNQNYKSINNNGLYTADGERLISGTTSGEVADGTKT